MSNTLSIKPFLINTINRVYYTRKPLFSFIFVFAICFAILNIDYNIIHKGMIEPDHIVQNLDPQIQGTNTTTSTPPIHNISAHSGTLALITLLLNIMLQTAFTVELIRFCVNLEKTPDPRSVFRWSTTHFRYLGALTLTLLLCFPIELLIISMLGLETSILSIISSSGSFETNPSNPSNHGDGLFSNNILKLIILIVATVCMAIYASISAIDASIKQKIQPIHSLLLCLRDIRGFCIISFIACLLWLTSLFFGNAIYTIPNLFEDSLATSLSLNLIISFVANYVILLISACITILIASATILWSTNKQ